MWRTTQVPRAILLIVIASLALRLFGVGHGLPFVYTADNETAFVDTATGLLLRRDPSPHWFGHPGSTVIYGQAALVAFLYYGSLILGIFSSFPEFYASFQSDPTVVYLTLRTASALLGAATVALVGLLGSSLFGRRAGAAAALLLAVAPLHHSWSQIARTDTPLTLLILGSVAASLLAFRSGLLRWYLLAGALAGLSAATKYPGGVAIAALVVAHLAREVPRRPTLSQVWRAAFDRRLWLGLGMVPLAFLAATPFAVLDWRQAIHDIAIEGRSSHLGADRLPGLANYLWYLQTALPTGLGVLAAVFAALGLLLALAARPREQLVLAAFPVLFLVVLGSASLRWDRWAIPLLPFAAVWAGYAWERLRGWIERITSRQVSSIAAAALLALVVAQPLSATLLHSYRQSQTDTRTLARDWVEANLPAGTTVAAELYTGFISRPDLKITTRTSLGESTLEDYREQGYDYLLVSDWMWRRFLAEPAKYPGHVAFYQRLFARASLIAEFSPRLDLWLGSRAGPTVRIYETPK